MIYKILPDYENYLALDLPMTKVMLSIGNKVSPQKLMHFYRHDIQLSEYWQCIEASFSPIDGVTKNETIPDVTTWAPGTLALSNEAREKLFASTNAGEFLPVNTPSGSYWILNISDEVDADERSSRRIIEAGQVLAVEKLVFNSKTAHPRIFKTEYDGFRNIFCNEAFKNNVKQHDCSGIIFSENLSTAFS